MAAQRMELSVIFKVLNKATEPLRKINQNFQKTSVGYKKFSVAAGRASTRIMDGFKGMAQGVARTSRRALPFLKKWATRLGIAGLATGALVRSTEKAADSIGKLSSRIGVSVKELDTWRLAADLAGAETQDADNMFDTLHSTITDAAIGVKGATDKLLQYNIAVHDSTGNMRDTQDVFDDVVRRIRSFRDISVQTKVAQDLLGISNKNMVFALRTNAAEARKAGKELNLFLDEKKVRMAERANDQYAILSKRVKNIGQSLLGMSYYVTKPITDILTAGEAKIREKGKSLKLQLPTPAPTGEQRFQISQPPSAVDLNVAITAPPGFSAAVTQTKSTGPANVKLKTSGYLGPTNNLD